MNANIGRTVTLTDVLAGKEEKARVQDELRRRHRVTVVGIAVNMPGPVKYSDATVDLVLDAVTQLRHRLRTNLCQLLEERICHAPTGPVAFLAIEGDAETIKKIAVSIEADGDYARLLDIDVHDADGRQLSRSDLGLAARCCLVCGEQAAICIRTRRHAPEEVLAAADRLLNSFRSLRTAG